MAVFITARGGAPWTTAAVVIGGLTVAFHVFDRDGGTTHWIIVGLGAAVAAGCYVTQIRLDS